MANPHLNDHDSLDLRRGLESLPQELYDQIYDETFTAPSGVHNLGDKTTMRYNLKLLQVSSTSRTQYAKTYYGNGVVFEVPQGHSLYLWLDMLPPTHRALLHKIIKHAEAPKFKNPSSPSPFFKQYCEDHVSAIRNGTTHRWDETLAAKIFLKAGGIVYG